MKMRKLFAGIAAAATMLGGLALGTTANATEADDHTPANNVYLGNTLKLNVQDRAQFKAYDVDNEYNRVTFKVARIASFDKIGEAGKDTIMVTTNNENSMDKFAVIPALQKAGFDYKDAYGDPMAWALGLEEDGFDVSNDSPWLGESQKSRKFAQALKNELTNPANYKAVTANLSEDGLSATLSLNKPGLYFILDTNNGDDDSSLDSTGTSQSIPILASTATVLGNKKLADGEVNMKNQKVTLTKSVVTYDSSKTGVDAYAKEESPDYAIGDTIWYELDTMVPVYTGYPTSGRIFKISDMASNEEADKQSDILNLQTSNVKVFVDGEQLDSSLYDVQITESGKAFTLDLQKYVNGQPKEGKTVKVFYAVTLGNNATSVKNNGTNGIKNESTLEYTSAVDSSSNVTSTVKDSAKIYTFRMLLKKQDYNTGKGLNAEFNVTAPNSKVSKLVTDENWGSAGMTGVDSGTYKVEETKAPEGYQDLVLPSFSFTITPTWDGEAGKKTLTQVNYSEPSGDSLKLVSKDTEDGALAWTYVVKNVKSITQLPLTGAAGTALFSVVALMVAAAGVTVYMRSRSTKRALNA